MASGQTVQRSFGAEALYRRGLAQYRLGNHRRARAGLKHCKHAQFLYDATAPPAGPDLEAALHSISQWRGSQANSPGLTNVYMSSQSDAVAFIAKG